MLKLVGEFLCNSQVFAPAVLVTVEFRESSTQVARQHTYTRWERFQLMSSPSTSTPALYPPRPRILGMAWVGVRVIIRSQHTFLCF